MHNTALIGQKKSCLPIISFAKLKVSSELTNNKRLLGASLIHLFLESSMFIFIL